MALEKIEKLHSNTELVLAIVNNYCEKHNEEPQFCGATKEARKLLGDAMKLTGSLLLLATLFKMVSKY